jgi:arginine-tRNA-protein transferase
MIYYEVHIPESLPQNILDIYLAAGWYRMQQSIFTTDIIVKDDSLVPVFWLRHLAAAYTPTPSHKKISKAGNKFTVHVVPFANTEELENLYQLYRASIDFDISSSLQESLLGEATQSIYHTTCVEIRDGHTLIAAGIIDEGENSNAGIHNFFHPAYARYSLGKFLILQKMHYTRQQGKAYYYTGYMSTAFSKLDYKLWVGINCTEVYNRNTDTWVPWAQINKNTLDSCLLQS